MDRQARSQTALFLGGCAAVVALLCGLLWTVFWKLRHPPPAPLPHYRGFQVSTQMLPAEIIWPFAQRLTDGPGMEIATPYIAEMTRTPLRMLVFRPDGPASMREQPQVFDLPQHCLPCVMGKDGAILCWDEPEGNSAAGSPAQLDVRLRWCQARNWLKSDRGFTFKLSNAEARVGVLPLSDGGLAIAENRPSSKGELHLWLEEPGQPPRDVQSVPDGLIAGTAWYGGQPTMTALTSAGHIYVYDNSHQRFVLRPELDPLGRSAAAGRIDAVALSDQIVAVSDFTAGQIVFLRNSGERMTFHVQSAVDCAPNGKPRLLPLSITNPQHGDLEDEMRSEAAFWRREAPQVPADHIGGPEAGSADPGWCVRVVPTGPNQLTVVDYFYSRLTFVSAALPAAPAP
jgi:hypothetical protein